MQSVPNMYQAHCIMKSLYFTRAKGKHRGEITPEDQAFNSALSPIFYTVVGSINGIELVLLIM